jgi:hypothetical protein
VQFPGRQFIASIPRAESDIIHGEAALQIIAADQTARFARGLTAEFKPLGGKIGNYQQ